MDTDNGTTTVLNEDPVETEDTQEGTTEEAAVENAQTEESESPELPEEDVYYDIDGEEISKAEILKWKSGHMMQSDYTRGKQEIAEQRKQAESKLAKATEAIEALDSMEEELLGLFADDKSVDMEELRQYDTAEYIRVKEQREQRQAKLAEIREKRLKLSDDLVEDERARLFEARGWKDSEETRAAETKLITELVKKEGVNAKAFGSITDHKILSLLIDAAKYRQIQEKKPAIAKLVKGKSREVSASKETKPRPKTVADIFYGSN